MNEWGGDEYKNISWCAGGHRVEPGDVFCPVCLTLAHPAVGRWVANEPGSQQG